MKRYKVLVLLSAISVVSCQEEIEQNDGEIGNAIPMSFYAGIENPKDSISTRTVLGGVSSDSHRSVLWKYQDEVYVTNGASSSKFVNTTEGTSDVALLEGELPQAPDYYAAYPFDMVKGYSASGFKIELPPVQTYYPDGVSSCSFPMVAQCDDGIFSFRNLCGIFVLRLTGDETISSVTFSGKDASGKCISVAGNGTVSMDYSGNPSLIMEDSAVTSVTLKSSEGVRLTPTQATTFHIVLPVGTYTTFTVIIKATDGTVMTVESKKALEIKRSKRTTAAAILYSGIIHYQDLNESGKTANCYIVSSPGYYKFKTCKGNSTDSVGEVNSVEVLWESFGTDVTPFVGDLVKNVSYKDGYLKFSTPSSFKEGNAVIAAKDASDNILWSWHIWLTDQPEEQVYFNNAGTMMDRNLGATSATPGDVCALGLLYQWGRKDPFLGSSSISSSTLAESTGSWPSSVSTSSSVGRVDYVTSHPTTFVYGVSSSDYDWHYASRDNTLWTTSEKTKSVYDPCPAGWRVPDGGDNGVWSKAGFDDITYDSTNKGMSFSIFSPSRTWYPASGYRFSTSGSLYFTGVFGEYWSSSISYSGDPYHLNIEADGDVNPLTLGNRDAGHSVRCVRCCSQALDGKPLASSATDLCAEGTANSYIVSKSGIYKLKPVKGNSSTSVGSVSSVELLWESFGTSETPDVGDLIKAVNYDSGYVVFSTPSSFREGNAVIAAKDASGTILWSWHIWLTDQPEEQVYYNNAGIMMDRNLGATSATPGDVGALGLLYQWGRKDPFLGSSSISTDVVAKSTTTWPVSVKSSPSTGTIEYATENPMTFIIGNTSNYDWFYPSSSYNENHRWMLNKTRYDPCPNGWRIPDINNGLWNMRSTGDFIVHPFDISNKGMDFSDTFGNAPSIWYPTAGYRYEGNLGDCGTVGAYWAFELSSNTTPTPFSLRINEQTAILLLSYYSKASGYSVRCIKE